MRGNPMPNESSPDGRVTAERRAAASRFGPFRRDRGVPGAITDAAIEPAGVEVWLSGSRCFEDQWPRYPRS